MKKISDAEFADFLVNKPLYYKVRVAENLTKYESAYIEHEDFKNKSFKFLCPKENDIQTFKTDYRSVGHVYFPITTMLRDSSSQLPYTFDKESRTLDLTIHLNGICQSCEYKIDFLIKATSDKRWDDRETGLTIMLQKVGQNPPYDIEINSTIKKYLTDEDKTNYKRAKICLSISYGIGAYAYLRRIIENEIKRIIKDLSDLDFEGVEHVRAAYSVYTQDFQMSKLIDVVNCHVPSSLKELGDNPIRLLYEQLSGGIHDFSDEQCMDKAQSIDILLNYVVKKLNEEKYQLGGVKNAMKNLRRS